MKTLSLTLLVVFALAPAPLIGSLGPGPWASGAYYPGGTDGKYQAAVYGNNIAGVIGFSIREGGPSVLAQPDTPLTSQTEDETAAAATVQAATAAAQAFDQTQNYFVIFVEGRTYTGLAVGSVNPRGKTVTGALLGAQPDFSFIEENLPFEFPEETFTTNIVIEPTFPPQFNETISITNIPGFTTTNITISDENTVVIIDGIQTTTNVSITNTNIVTIDPIIITNTNRVPVLVTNTNVQANVFPFSVTGVQGTTNVFNPLPILNRGLSGGFQAKLRNNKAYMSFRGSGELSAPNLSQTLTLSTNAAGDTVTGAITTETASFKLDGIRTSFLTTQTPVAPTAR